MSPTALANRPKAPRNLPSTTSQSLTGMVMSHSSVPDDRSSASKRMESAGANAATRNEVQKPENSSRTSAWRPKNNVEKNRTLESRRKTAMKMYAMGELKYEPNSRLAMASVFRISVPRGRGFDRWLVGARGRFVGRELAEDVLERHRLAR